MRRARRVVPARPSRPTRPLTASGPLCGAGRAQWGRWEEYACAVLARRLRANALIPPARRIETSTPPLFARPSLHCSALSSLSLSCFLFNLIFPSIARSSASARARPHRHLGPCERTRCTQTCVGSLLTRLPSCLAPRTTAVDAPAFSPSLSLSLSLSRARPRAHVLPSHALPCLLPPVAPRPFFLLENAVFRC